METLKSNTAESRKVRIANPLYDYAFKYLLEDNTVARKFISTIIGEEVVELTFSPQEYVNGTEPVTDREWNYCRLDFVAQIRADEEVKAVMIEVQKVSMDSDVIRFRRYLGAQYQMRSMKAKKKKKNEEVEVTVPIPIYCIFVLGDGIGIKDIPVIKVDIEVTDNADNRELPEKNNEFIKNLHHRSWIVQVPELKDRRRNDVEVLLSIFDQTYRTEEDHTFLDVREEFFPEEYRPVIRRLELAAADSGIRHAMQVEDDYYEQIRYSNFMKEKAEEETEAAVAVIAEKDIVIAEKEALLVRERAEKEAAIAAVARERAEKEAAIARERAEKEALLAELAALKAKSNTEK
jgi:hypothetical protein